MSGKVAKRNTKVEESVEVTEDDVDNGYVKTVGGTICMSWAKKAQ